MRFDLSAWELAHLIWRRRWRFLLVATVPVLAAIAACALVRPHYDSTVALIVTAGHAASLEPDADRMMNLSRQDRIVNAKVAILESELVVRKTIEDVGPGILYPDINAKLLGALVEQVFLLGQPFFLRDPAGRPAEIAQRQELIDAAYLRIRRALRIESRPNSDIVRVTFRHADPELAARFANQHASNFIERDMALGRMHSAASFLREQQEKHLAALKETSSMLAEFARVNQIYALDEQRRLALRRHSELTAARAASRSAAAEKEEQTRSITTQLSLMKPVSNLPEVARLASVNGGAPRTTPSLPANARDRGAPTSEMLARDPPLLLVRVYQDTIQGLVRVNAELAGVKALKESQSREIAKTDAELALLGEKEAEFLRLQAAVAQARENVEAYSRKSAVQQAEADLSARNLSNIVIAQPAARPLEPAFPNPALILLLGVSSGILVALVAVLLPAPAQRRLAAPHTEPSLIMPPARREPIATIAHISDIRRMAQPRG